VLTKASVNNTPLPPKMNDRKVNFFSLEHWVETMDRYILWSKLPLFCRRHLSDFQAEVLLQFSVWRKPLMLAQKVRF